MKAARDNPNPAGKVGKPFTLAPHKFDDALRKILATPPEPKATKHKAPKAPRKASKKKAVRR